MKYVDLCESYEDLTEEAFRSKIARVFDHVMELETYHLRMLFESSDFWEYLCVLEDEDAFGTEGMKL